jgi:hypothetical protein
LNKNIFAIFFCLLHFSCFHRSREISFYYWRTRFKLDSIENDALRFNGVKTLQVRYFDVDFVPDDSIAKPVSPVVFESSLIDLNIIPVIFIKKRVFERIREDSINSLANSIFRLVSSISHSIKKAPDGIQFDCDWTEKTKEKYFLFLRSYRSLTKSGISCTIRLHQVKYPAMAGIPPVDYGVLMFYNMGDINTGAGNSVYQKEVAEKYSPSIKSYPLALDLALPIFSWALQLREGRVIQLLNKMSFPQFENDSNFIRVSLNRYSVKSACFRGGYYFRENDSVKVERVSKENLFDIVTQVNANSNHKIRNLVFYDLDQRNIALYDKNIFREIRSRIR